MNKDSKIYIAGHTGLVGGAIERRLKADEYTNLLVRTYEELDLTNQPVVDDFFAKEKPEYVFLAAAKVGGIVANSTYPADFIYQNTMIGFNVIHAAYKYGVKKLINLGCGKKNIFGLFSCKEIINHRLICQIQFFISSCQ